MTDLPWVNLEHAQHVQDIGLVRSTWYLGLTPTAPSTLSLPSGIPPGCSMRLGAIDDLLKSKVSFNDKGDCPIPWLTHLLPIRL